MNITTTELPAPLEWESVHVSEMEQRDAAREMRAGTRIVDCWVTSTVLMSGDGELGIVAKQRLAVEMTVENDPKSNCVGVDLSYARIGEPRVTLVGNWGDAADAVDLRRIAAMWPSDGECAAEALSVLRSAMPDAE